MPGGGRIPRHVGCDTRRIFFWRHLRDRGCCGSASFINAPPLVRVSLPTADPSIYLACGLGVTFPVLLLVGLPLIAQLVLLWERLLEPGGR
ncbi:sodium-dependent bicarbonate transport family permease [Steroidobacter agaridevorans]|uniref:sodium-dependent bicarbonate transport family permease n=1 Tax=Steroidobacter agaridevorans TaxID=2695856 RepID=UPI0022A80147|nr:sodium-dependent bicarbonate transport family permease [Steroidobacter agaridevorans]